MSIRDVDFNKLSELIAGLENYDHNDLYVLITKYYPKHDYSLIKEVLIDLGIIPERFRQQSLIGHKGTQYYDIGSIYCPYIPDLVKNNIPADSNLKTRTFTNWRAKNSLAENFHCVSEDANGTSNG